MTDHRTDQKNRIPANKLSDKEIQQIIDEFNNRKEHGEESITAYSIAYSLMDKGEYVASPSTIARYIRAYMLEINPSLAERQIADEGLEKHHVSTGALPEGIATGPNTVWVADTTYLNTDIKGKYYYLLTIMDLYSRKIVHWEIVEREDSLMQIKCLMKQPKVFFIEEPAYLHYEDMPNDRIENLEMIRIYDEELRKTLQPQWERYRSAFVGHQIKVYEKFIDKRQFHVLDAYYRPLRKQLDKSIPFADRLALLLPPRISYFFVHYYKLIRKHHLRGN